MKVIRSNQRGKSSYSWLKSFHSFSFGDYYDSENTEFGKLRVLNDDLIKGGGGFDSHPHRDMEIVTIVLNGAVKHQDSLGNEYRIGNQEIQVMTAGSGIIHSEYNDSKDQDLELLQIWILPNQKQLKPKYKQMKYSLTNRINHLEKIISPKKEPNSLTINQDVSFYIGNFTKNNSFEFKNENNRGTYIFLIEGDVSIESKNLKNRDAISISEPMKIHGQINQNSSILLIDTPL